MVPTKEQDNFVSTPWFHQVIGIIGSGPTTRNRVFCSPVSYPRKAVTVLPTLTVFGTTSLGDGPPDGMAGPGMTMLCPEA